MRMASLLTVAIVAAALSACGSGKPDTGTSSGGSTGNATNTASAAGDASAEQVAKEARGDLKCPADVPPKPAEQPVDDVVGVRPGMSWEQAANVVMCSNPLLVVTPETGRGFDLQTFGQTVRQGFSARFAEPRVQKTGQQIAREMEQEALYRSENAARHDTKPGQTKWFVGTMGMPGQERVISAAREEWFAEGKNPTVESVSQALIGKYGTPTHKLDQSGDRQLRWAYDPRGRLITETSPLYGVCQGTANPDGGVNLSADCGVVVAAVINTLRDNPELSQSMQVGVVDQAGGYSALAATEQGLQAMDAQRRAEQVQDAAKNAQAPQL